MPGGILLWGPPGTGKTLMAQAVAGETAKPFVNVDAGAFINMFMGVGIPKVRPLPQLRKLSMRYGGTIMFIDEADSLGSRGQQVATGLRAGPYRGPLPPPATGSPISPTPDATARSTRRSPWSARAPPTPSGPSSAAWPAGAGARCRRCSPRCRASPSRGGWGEQDPRLRREAQAPAEVSHPAHLCDEHAQHA